MEKAGLKTGKHKKLKGAKCFNIQITADSLIVMHLEKSRKK